MDRDIYYINVKRKRRNTAGMKAPADISEICKQLGFKEFPMPMFPSSLSKFFQKIWLFFICTYYWLKLWATVGDGDIVLYQHPMYGNRVSAYFIPQIQKDKNCKFIVVIHDLESLRGGIEGVIVNNKKTNEMSDNMLLKQFDAVICHNEHMKKYLISQGFNADKLVCLGIFDYLCNYNERGISKGKDPSIAIAGNLASGKSAYIYDILNKNNTGNSDLTIHLYGENFDESKISKQIIYHGSFKPEELPAHLEGDFGLVWDGPSAETCKGNTGEYLRYNDPHKTSLYLAGGMPVIVWGQAAVADFVLEHDVGITVNSLDDIGDVISDISDDRYQMLCKNAIETGRQIQNGWYFKIALQKCMQILGDTNTSF